MDLASLQHENLTAVEFVEDYLQLRFNDALLSFHAWPQVADGDGIAIAYGEPGYRDALCSVLGESVASAAHEEGDSITVEFENGTVVALSLREEDLDTPEAGSFTGSDGSTEEF